MTLLTINGSIGADAVIKEINGKRYYQVSVAHHNGKEDTVKYLAMKKVAERQSQKSEKLREQHVEYTDSNGNVRERQSVEKLKPLQKTVQMLKAMREVKKSLKR